MQRSAMRELAFKLMYALEIQQDLNNIEQVEIFIENNEITDSKAIEYLKDMQKGISENSAEINKLIENNFKKNWSWDRVSKVNLSLIKIAVYEMLYKNLPYKVATNEVIELAKKYSDESAPMFINGILASIIKEKNLDKKDE